MAVQRASGLDQYCIIGNDHACCCHARCIRSLENPLLRGALRYTVPDSFRVGKRTAGGSRPRGRVAILPLGEHGLAFDPGRCAIYLLAPVGRLDGAFGFDHVSDDRCGSIALARDAGNYPTDVALAAHSAVGDWLSLDSRLVLFVP